MLNHVTGLIDMGYAVDIYAFGAEVLEQYRHRQLDEYQLTSRTTYLPKEPDHQDITRQFLERDYCAIHCHFGLVSERMAFLRKHLRKTTFVVTFHGMDIRRAVADGNQLLHSTFHAFDWFISICKYNRTRLEQLGCPAGRILDLPNGVNTSVFAPRKRPPGASIRIITVARLHRNKNIPFALQVMSRLIQAGLDFSYDILGHGPDRPELELLIEELDLSLNVTLHGQCSQDEVAEKLAGSDIFFLPSRAEASPVCILEAQACALPIVATRVGGVEELVLDGSNGFIVESEDQEAAVGQILYLARHPDERIRMGRKGRKQVCEHHELKVMLERYAELYGLKPTPAVDD